MSQTYRVQIHHSILLITFILFGIALAIYSAIHQSYILTFIAAVFVIAFFSVELQRRKVKIELTQDSILAELEKNRFQAPWHTILMARRVKPNNAVDFIELGTVDDIFRIDLRLFNGNRIWNQIQARVSPEALQEEAYKRLPAFQKWLTERENLVEGTTTPLIVQYHWISKVGAFLALIIFTFIGTFSIFIFANTELWVSNWICFGPMVLFGLWICIGTMFTRVEMTSEGVKAINPWKRREIKWERVEYIKFG